MGWTSRTAKQSNCIKTGGENSCAVCHELVDGKLCQKSFEVISRKKRQQVWKDHRGGFPIRLNTGTKLTEIRSHTEKAQWVLIKEIQKIVSK